MTTSDKLGTMEALWDDLCRSGDELSSPSWHGEVLSERDTRVAEGKEEILDWDEAKERMRRSL